MNDSAVSVAKAFISCHFPDCKAAVLAGSVIRGDDTETSDLDIVVIQATTEHSRQSYEFQNWPIEVFLHNPDSLAFYLEMEEQQGIPMLIRMCAEGMVLKGEKEAEFATTSAKSLLQNGPCPWTRKEIDTARYNLTDLITDLEGSQNEKEDIFTVNELTDQVHQFLLRPKQRWVGKGKWIYRSLADFDVRLSDRLVDCLLQFYQFHEKEELIQFVDDTLHPYGGRFFEHFTE